MSSRALFLASSRFESLLHRFFCLSRPRQSASRLEQERCSTFLLSALDRTKNASQNGSKKLPKCSRNLPSQASQNLKTVLLVVLGTSENHLNALLGPVLSFSALFFQNCPKKLLKRSQSLSFALFVLPFSSHFLSKRPQTPRPAMHPRPQTPRPC